MPLISAQAAPPPLVLGIEQVDAAACHLARYADERPGATGREVRRLELRRRLRGQRSGARSIAHRAPVAPPAEPGNQPALNRRGALELDQLLTYGPGQGLERVGPTGRAQPRRRAYGWSNQRVEAEAVIERLEVLIDPQG
jgi:hypothetical protein